MVANFVLADEINRAPGEGAVGAAGGDGRAARVDRRPDLPDARPVPGARHPEPDRERGRLPAARGAARPVPVQDHRGLPGRRGGARDRLPDGRRAAGRRSRCWRPPSWSRLQSVATRVFVHHALVDYVVRLVVATRTPAEHGLADVAGWVAYGASPRATLGIVARRPGAGAGPRPRLRAAPGRARRRAGRAAAPAGAVLRRAGRRGAGRPHHRPGAGDRAAAAGHRPPAGAPQAATPGGRPRDGRPS